MGVSTPDQTGYLLWALPALCTACSEHCTATCISPRARVRGAASLAASSNILSAQASENPGFERVLNSGRVNKLRAGYRNIK